MKLGDDQAHLQAPVAQVDIPDGPVAQIPVQPFQGFADNGGAQMPDVQGLCHIRAAVIHHHGFPGADLLRTEVRLGAHGFQILPEKGPGELQVNKARHHRFHQVVILLIQLCGHSPGDLNGGAVILLGGGKGAVALIFTQVRPVGYRHPPVGRVVACVGKGPGHFFGNLIQYFLHTFLLLFFPVYQICAEKYTPFSGKTVKRKECPSGWKFSPCIRRIFRYNRDENKRF